MPAPCRHRFFYLLVSPFSGFNHPSSRNRASDIRDLEMRRRRWWDLEIRPRKVVASRDPGSTLRFGRDDGGVVSAGVRGGGWVVRGGRGGGWCGRDDGGGVRSAGMTGKWFVRPG